MDATEIMKISILLLALASFTSASGDRNCTWINDGTCKKLRCTQTRPGSDFYFEMQKELQPSSNKAGCFSLEIVHPNGNVIKSISLDKQHQFKELRLSNGIVKKIEGGSFSKFVNLSKLHLDNNQLESVKLNDDLKNLDELYLNDNSIKKITKEDLPKSPELKVLDVSRNHLTTLDDLTCNYANLEELTATGNDVSTLGGCVSTNNKKLKTLDLSHNNLQELGPSNTLGKFDRLETLRLNHNKLKSVPKQLDLPKLRQLNLDNNKLDALNQDSFNNLTQLRELSLDDNKIAKIAPGTFQNLHRLKHLSLRGNCIEDLKKDTFQGLDNVEELDLSGLGIKQIDAGAFEGLNDLKRLDLTENPLDTVDPNAFNALKRLESLKLSYGPLKANAFSSVNLKKLKKLTFVRSKLRKIDEDVPQVIPANAFSGLTDLKELDLSGLGLTGIEVGAFNGLRKLHDLLLGNNKLNKIDANTLDGLSDLNRLELQSNAIADISKGAFAPLSHLNHLDLSNNSLDVLRTDVLKGLYNMRFLDLRSNPIRTLQKSSITGSPFLKELFLGKGLVAIEPHAFGTLHYLKSLTISGANIPDLQNQTFSGLDGLISLTFVDSNIGVIWQEAFAGLSNLVTLKFVGASSIEVIKSGVFKSLPLLQNPSGDFSGLGIKRVEAGAFDGLNASALDLSKNKLTVLFSDNFAGTSGIVALNLRENQISYAADDSLENLPDLQKLDLSHNVFKELPRKVLSPLSQLTELDVSSNLLKTFDRDAIADLPLLKRLNFYGNPLKCSDSRALLDVLRDHGISSNPDQVPNCPTEAECSSVAQDVSFEDIRKQADQLVRGGKAGRTEFRDFPHMPEVRKKIRQKLALKRGSLKANLDGGEAAGGGLTGLQIALVALCAIVVLAQIVFFARRCAGPARRTFRFTRRDSEIELLNGRNVF